MIELEEQGLCYIREGKYLEAIKAFNKIIDKNPSYEHGNIYYNLGGCYEDIGKLDKAEECYKKVLEYEPNDTIKLGGLGSLYFIQKRYKEALDIYTPL